MESIKIEHLTFSYAGEETPALNDVSFSVARGSCTVLCGETGCGKSTLLRLFKPGLLPRGVQSGQILWNGTDVRELPAADGAARIGYVAQRPTEQIVCDKVFHELAFGLENLGVSPADMHRRVAEVVSYFGLEQLYDAPTDRLSGGQMQLLNLASVVALRPEVLLLDEPTSQLDPIAAASFLAAVERLCRETALTVLIAEHRLEDVLPLCDQLAAFRDGKLVCCEPTRTAVARLAADPSALAALPAPARLKAALFPAEEIPLSVREGRDMLARAPHPPAVAKAPLQADTQKREILRFNHVSFRYERKAEDVLSDCSLRVNEGERFFLLGGNGGGKTTALRIAAGLCTPYTGELFLFGQRQKRGQAGELPPVALLPQDVETLFLTDSVSEELARFGKDLPRYADELRALGKRHPYDLSGGEKQLLALELVLATKPRLLLLDEPTQGLDCRARERLKTLLDALHRDGVTIVTVTHDLDFAAECADRCALLFRGEVVFCDDTHRFFSSSSYYTTAVHRMTEEWADDIITVEDCISRYRGAEEKQ